MDEDALMLVIVGDDDIKEEKFNIKQDPVGVKSETVPVGEIIENAVKHGEVIKIEAEEDDEYEYLEEDEIVDPDCSLLKELKVKKKRNRSRKPKVEEHENKSFVQKLREENPEFVEDPSKLVEHLANMMKELKEPKLPPDFCKINVENELITYVCKICQKEHESQNAVAKHYQTFHGERYLQCYACGRDFTFTAYLYKHEKTCKAPDAEVVLQARGRYLGVKGRGRPFTTNNRFKLAPDPGPRTRKRQYCSQCPASFSLREYLEAHERAHAGLKPHRCHICVAAYTSPHALKRHLQAHSEDRKYICDTCGSAFKFKPVLISHMNTHLPYPKYGCEQCPSRFAEKVSLRNHMNKVHLKLPPQHGCPLCPKRYPRLAQVKNHLKKEHGLIMITEHMTKRGIPTKANIDMQQAHAVHNSVQKCKALLIPNIEEETVQNASDSDTDDAPKVTKKWNEKKVYKIQTEGNKKVYEVPIVNADDPNAMDGFVKFIHSVKPGSKVVKVEKQVPKAQCLKSYCPPNLQPKFKMVYNNE